MWKNIHEKFYKEVKEKMEKGDLIFKNKSFNKDSEKLLTEIQDELIDVVGWAEILYKKIEDIKEILK